MGLFEILEQKQIKSIIKKIRKYYKRRDILDKEYTNKHIENILMYTNGIFNAFSIPEENATVDTFQTVLRNERTEYQKGIRLVAFDLSKTIIKYTSTYDLKLAAAQLISDKLFEYGLGRVKNPDIVTAIEDGITKYSRIRKESGLELPEHTVYKQFIVPQMINKPLKDQLINDIILIWRENSVHFTLNCNKLFDLVQDLQQRGILVVTVSDMLGDMSFFAMKKLGILNLFDAHFCSSNLGVRKNNKENSLFSQVNNIMNIPPENCLMIGNDIIDDIESSRNLGFHTIFVDYGDKKANVLCDVRVNSTDEIYDLYNKLPSLPRILLTPYNQKHHAQRIDSQLTQLQYQLRTYAKRHYNRTFRSFLYSNYLLSHMGQNTRIGNNFEVRYPDRIYIGDNCQINDDATILNEGFVIIGNDVMIAKNVFISTYFHDWRVGMIQDKLPSWAKGNTITGTVSIESNSWVGPDCVFEPNVYIGHHSVIAAKSFVQSGIYPPYSFIAGCPASIKRNISNELTNAQKCYVME